MCILCVIQKWSRRVATMLPWLVIPLIGLWALSQLLPPAFRFEITSPRLACVFVLLVTLFWYEILMPQLSAWRARRNARLRERKRNEAIELQKLRKTATRKCRNCLTPYKDQNPGGGKFMCSYCGRISKRPVLDLPVPPGMGISSSGIIKDFVGKGGKLLNGKAWSDNGWMCSQDWLENGNWVSGSFSAKPGSWQKNESRLFGGDDDCLAEKSYSGVVIFACKLLTSFFFSIRWLWRKIFRSSSFMEDATSDAEHSELLTKRGENGGNFHESRSEKARRKAEEKRQARLEKEMLEEEERKQREEVARLVEEQRKKRDEMLDAEKSSEKVPSPTKDQERKKEAERKRQERRRDRDKGSSKSNSDAEDLEKRVGKESDHRHEPDKKSENDRKEPLKSAVETIRSQNIDGGRGSKSISPANSTKGSAGTRYLDRMRGTILSSSKAFTGSGFFGRAANTPPVTKDNSRGSINHVHNSNQKREILQPERANGKPTLNENNKNIYSPVLLEPQPVPPPKKSWQQLFTRSSTVHPSSTTNVISRPSTKPQAEVQGFPLPGQLLPAQSFDNPINFGLPSPFAVSSYQNVTTSSSLGFSSPMDPIFPLVGERLHDFIPEEPEQFEDPCYVPDPMSLLGPVSESLDNFQLDKGTGFIPDMGVEKLHPKNNACAAPEINRRSPIESPISRPRGFDDRQNNTSRFPSTSKVQDMHNLPVEDASANDKGSWQMWDTSPLGQDGLSLLGGRASWNSNNEWNRVNREDFVPLPTQKTVTSLFPKEDGILPGSFSPQKDFIGRGRNGGSFSPVASTHNQDPWVQKAFIPPLSDSEIPVSLAPPVETAHSEMFYGCPTGSSVTHPFQMSPANCWSNKEWAAQGSSEGVGMPPVASSPIGVHVPTEMYSHFGNLEKRK